MLTLLCGLVHIRVDNDGGNTGATASANDGWLANFLKPEVVGVTAALVENQVIQVKEDVEVLLAGCRALMEAMTAAMSRLFKKIAGPKKRPKRIILRRGIWIRWAQWCGRTRFLKEHPRRFSSKIMSMTDLTVLR